MVSSRQKGAKYVNEAIKLLESIGYACWKPGNAVHFIGPGRAVSQSQDIFELFDIIASNWSKLLLVQVKANESHASEARTAISGFPCPDTIGKLVMMRINGKPGQFIVWNYLPMNKEWIRGTMGG